MKCVSTLGLALAAWLVTVPPLAAQTIDIAPNFVGLGVGVTPRYAGASEDVVGAMPGIRYQVPGSRKFFEWYGPLASFSLTESERWQFGPSLGFRFGRSEVEDAVVRLLPEVDTTIEGGAMLSWTYLNTAGIPWRVRVGGVALTDLGDTYNGLNSSFWSSLWLPLSPRVFIGLGGGFSWSSSSFNQAYFGVTPAGSAASGLPVYTPGSGVRQWYAWPALVVRLSDHWVGGVGVFYQRLAGPAADSPIVTQRGDRNQITAGVGIGYLWR